MKQIKHPGSHIRNSVIPNKLNVTDAAKKLAVSRSTLSNLINGNADLSAEMAGKLAKAFGADAQDLMNMQTVYDAEQASKIAHGVTSYVPPFLDIKADAISEWANKGLKPRQRFAVFLRTLVNSTCQKISRINFPANDDSQRPGPDGEVESNNNNPWVPKGNSFWEFGVTGGIKQKADDDFAKSVKALDPSDRKNATFIFVTPHRWPKKSDWETAHRKKGLFANVRAYDASDLEQWLAESIPAQVWFANETGQSAEGAISLDQAWSDWQADCTDALTPALFDSAVEQHKATISRIINSVPHTSCLITSDSCDEALAYLSRAFASDNEEFGHLRDKVVIFTKIGALSKLANKVSNFIPVVASREVERELAPFMHSLKSFRIYPHNTTSNEPDIALQTLSYEAFDKALKETSLDPDYISQLHRASGRSLTVLRRRLSEVDAISKPEWSHDNQISRTLIPALFAGTWKGTNNADTMMIEHLAGDISIEKFDQQFVTLLPLDGSPIWAAGAFRGVVSKIDLLFAISHAITDQDLRRFYEAAELILSERDPSLSLPEDKRWWSFETRAMSGALREGVAETLVLLSVHGNFLFKDHTSIDCEFEAERLIEKMLIPLGDDTLENHIDNLPLYAEAAPEKLLNIIENDLGKSDSKVMALIRPSSSSPFSSSPRTGLLWALENLAWSQKLFPRVVLVLGKLAEKPLDDNLMNKPANSLDAIFRNWMPQTSADIKQRIAALKGLATKYPKAAWPICIAQFEVGSRSGSPSHKPRWRPDAHGYGKVTTYDEINNFALLAFDITIKWPSHSHETITDLLRNISALDEPLQEKVWDLVEQFGQTATDADKALLQEAVRTSALGVRRESNNKRPVSQTSKERAWAAYKMLKPSDPIEKHSWLFRTSWIMETARELEDEDYDFSKRDERIKKQRLEAVAEIYQDGGIDNIIKLAKIGETAHIIGGCLVDMLQTDTALIQDLIALIQRTNNLDKSLKSLLSGALHRANWEKRPILEALLEQLDDHLKTQILCLAPFEQSTWNILDIMSDCVKESYWQDVAVNICSEDEDRSYAISQLIYVDRPRAAFAVAHCHLKKVDSRQLVTILQNIITSQNEPADHYKVDGYYIKKALEVLNNSGITSYQELGAIEYQFLDLFKFDEGQPVNLEKWIEHDPELFVHAIAFAYKRNDGKDDPPELKLATEEQQRNTAEKSYTLLDTIKYIPGHDDKGNLDDKILLKWISKVREKCSTLGRADIADQMIGQLLSHAAADQDGLWPCKAVRDALEEIMNDNLESGLSTACFNSRGVHYRGEGGQQERDIAARYGGWAERIEYTHPRVGSFLRNMENRYLRDADREDETAQINRRMRLS